MEGGLLSGGGAPRPFSSSEDKASSIKRQDEEEEAGPGRGSPQALHTPRQPSTTGPAKGEAPVQEVTKQEDERQNKPTTPARPSSKVGQEARTNDEKSAPDQVPAQREGPADEQQKQEQQKQQDDQRQPPLPSALPPPAMTAPNVRSNLDDVTVQGTHTSPATATGPPVQLSIPEPVPDRIQAYAKLEFPFFNFYIQKLSVTIGRRPPESRNGSQPPQPPPVSIPPLPSPGAFNAGRQTHVKQEQEQGEAHNNVNNNSVNAGIPTGGSPFTSTLDASISNQDSKLSKKDGSSKSRSKGSSKSHRLAGNKVQVDVDLGPIKAVSRDHARLFFDDTLNPRTNMANGWSIEVKGRNGLVLDGKWRAKGEVARLVNR